MTAKLDLALQASGRDQTTVLHKPRLLSDNGSSYISGELAEWLEDQQMDNVRAAPYSMGTVLSLIIGSVASEATLSVFYLEGTFFRNLFS